MALIANPGVSFRTKLKSLSAGAPEEQKGFWMTTA